LKIGRCIYAADILLLSAVIALLMTLPPRPMMAEKDPQQQ
jgi:hypothetical protein